MRTYIFKLLFVFLLVITQMSHIFASSYIIEFNQIGDKILVNETINNESKVYYDNGLIERNYKELYFVKRIDFNQSFTYAEIRLKLDKGIILKNELIYPSGYSFISDGERIGITWKLENIIQNRDFAIFVTLNDVKPNYNDYILIGFGILLMFIIVYFFISKFKKKRLKIKKTETFVKKVKQKDEKYDYLLDDEKKVIEILKKADRNELWQKQILNLTHFSKAKLSRLIRNLESRGLVRKIPFGNTNKIRLK